MGIMLMKTVRPKETIQGINPENLVRFALSLDGPSGIAVGMDSKKVVDSNLKILRNFNPMSKDEMTKFAMMLSPFRHENLEWMKVDRDGVNMHKCELVMLQLQVAVY
jgi:predicted aldo/keto reductase-like oxidoreductase